MKQYKGTRYYGEKHQRKTNGYCQNYNKGLKLLENQNVVIDYEQTRIEIVDKPERRIPLAELLQHPPEQNKHYFAAVVTDWERLPMERAEQTRRLRDGADIDEVTPYIRKKVKETLAHPYQINFTSSRATVTNGSNKHSIR